MFQKKFRTAALALALVLICSQAALADYGIKAGLASSTMAMSDNVGFSLDLKSVTGIMIGGYMTLPVAGNLSIQPEALYIQKGARYMESFDGVDVEASMRIDYIEVPVLAKLEFPSRSALTPMVCAGPYAAFKISAKNKVSAPGYSQEETLEGVKSTDFGLAFGGGLKYDLGNMVLAFELRYHLGLSATNDSEADGVSLRNRTIEAGIGLGF
ncbi:MAG: porin family protein [Candidatus Aminicenantales bacterium]